MTICNSRKEASRENKLVDNLILYFQPQVLQGNKFQLVIHPICCIGYNNPIRLMSVNSFPALLHTASIPRESDPLSSSFYHTLGGLAWLRVKSNLGPSRTLDYKHRAKVLYAIVSIHSFLLTQSGFNQRHRITKILIHSFIYPHKWLYYRNLALQNCRHWFNGLCKAASLHLMLEGEVFRSDSLGGKMDAKWGLWNECGKFICRSLIMWWYLEVGPLRGH